MNILKKHLLFCASLISLIPLTTDAECFKKIELAPAYIHIDVLEQGNTVKDIDLAAIRGEFSYVMNGGWSIKPLAFYGKSYDSEIWSAGLQFGRCIPINNYIILTPEAGFNYTDLSTSIKIDFGDMVFEFQEEFTSWTPYIGLDAVFKISSCSRLYLTAQYGWSFAKTEIKDLDTFDSDSNGPIYGVMFEYDLTKCWSVNLGAAYNESLSRDKNGIRGRGVKLGLAYWY